MNKYHLILKKILTEGKEQANKKGNISIPTLSSIPHFYSLFYFTNKQQHLLLPLYTSICSKNAFSALSFLDSSSEQISIEDIIDLTHAIPSCPVERPSDLSAINLKSSGSSL